MAEESPGTVAVDGRNKSSGEAAETVPALVEVASDMAEKWRERELTPRSTTSILTKKGNNQLKAKLDIYFNFFLK